MADGFISKAKTVKSLISHYDFLIVVLLFASVWILRLIDLTTYPVPVPTVHDESANYLGAKTFALGRLTNPTHAFLNDSLAEIYVLPEPTRMMKYQPMMAGFMALGIVVFGHAYWGVVLLVSLAVAASYWAMRGWAEKTTSIFFSVFLLFMLRAPHYWINSYWGGAHALLGSFLLIGAYPRIIYNKEYGSLWVATLGTSVLLLSRSYEGALLTLSFFICAIVTIWHKFKKEEIIIFFKKASVPIIIVGGACLLFQLYYNKTITGNYLTLPYAQYQIERDTAPVFWFLSQHKERTSEHFAIKGTQDWQAKPLNTNHWIQVLLYFPGTLVSILGKNYFIWSYITKITFIIIVLYPLALYFILKERKYITLHICLLVQAIGYMMITWLFISHYLTTFFSLLSVLIALYLRDLYINTHRKYYFKAIYIPIFIMFLISSPGETFSNIDYSLEQSNLRQSIIAELNKKPGKHLVMVDQHLEYKEGTGDYSFVYNEPDIDDSNIVWAWYLSPEQNRKLLDYYKDRKVWYIETYREKRLIPYAEHKEYP